MQNKQQTKIITLFKGLLLDDWTIQEYTNTVVVLTPKGYRAFTITHDQLELLKKKILLFKTPEPTRNIYKLMPLTQVN